MNKVKVVQLSVNDSETKAERLDRVESYLGQIAEEENGPLMVILPELWGTGFFNFNRYIDESESLEGETYSRLAPWAEKGNFYILGGSIIERDGSDYYNTALLIGPNGFLSAVYRKVHLFGYQSRESRLLTPGQDIMVIRNAYGTWGISTCYDLRFPELYRKMLEGGVDTFFILAAWPAERLEHWLLLNRARALENLAYVVACNCAGTINDHTFAGNSLVVDPWGVIQARGGDKEELLTFHYDPVQTASIRSEFPAVDDRTIGIIKYRD
jgi:predicted amidohydrolase